MKRRMNIKGYKSLVWNKKVRRAMCKDVSKYLEEVAKRKEFEAVKEEREREKAEEAAKNIAEDVEEELNSMSTMDKIKAVAIAVKDMVVEVVSNIFNKVSGFVSGVFAR